MVRASDPVKPNHLSIGLLIARLGFGLSMAFGHGYGKLLKILDGNFNFPDPLGMGAVFSLSLATFGEFVCGLAIALGLWTRYTAIPAFITMATAFFIFHANDPWQKKELAFLYAVAFLFFIFSGSGKWSLDRYFGR